MNSKSTWRWFWLAAVLFGLVCLVNHPFGPSTDPALVGWPKFEMKEATSVQVIPAGALEIRADRTNDNWFLSKPIIYPAQAMAIRAFLDSLGKLVPAARISASELGQQTAAAKDYGFDNPQSSLVITTPSHEWQLIIGRHTAPGDQVFVRVVGVEGAFVTDAGWLNQLPTAAAQWRDTSLIGMVGAYDWIVLTNGAKEIELHLDPTNHLWRMTRPLQARADSDRINRAIEQLRTARVENFVTDDPHADLSGDQLLPASLDLWLGREGHLTDGLHFGKSLTNNPGLVYAKREGWDAVMTTAMEPLSPWRGAVNDFRDTHLVDLTAPVREIEVWAAATSDHYLLRQEGTNAWRMAGEKYPIDADSVRLFIQGAGALTASDFVTDVVTPADLQTYGLTHPAIQLTLRTAAGDTNHALAQIAFSARQTNGIVYARRSDEDFIYGLEDPGIPVDGWEFRDHKIWNFREAEITRITLHQDGQVREIVHNGVNSWSLAPGSPGQVYGPTIEETAHELGLLSSYIWYGRKVTNPEKFGVTPKSLRIEVTLKNGQTYALAVGGMYQNMQLALVNLDGEVWGFALPQNLDQLLLSYLTIPANVP